MKNAARLVVLPFTITIVIAMLVSAACAPSAEITLVSTPEPTVSETAAPTASPTPTAIPTPTIDKYGFTEERKAELNQQIQDFLNYQGEYSKGNIKKYLLPIGYGKDKFYNLGLIQSSESVITVQPWLFDYVEKDGDLLLITGFDGKDNQRFVTVLNIPLHFVDIYPQSSGVALIKLNGWSANGGQVVGGSNDLDTIKSHLIKGNPMLIDFISSVASDEEAKEVGGDVLADINRYYRHNLSYIGNLIYQIDQNGETLENTLESSDKEIIKIDEISDIDGLDHSTLPIVGIIEFTN